MNLDPFAELKQRQREMWASFGPTALFTTPVAGHVVRFAGIVEGETVLDVGTGTGVLAITAARMGAKVTGLDLTPELIEQARENAGIAGVPGHPNTLLVACSLSSAETRRRCRQVPPRRRSGATLL